MHLKRSINYFCHFKTLMYKYIYNNKKNNMVPLWWINRHKGHKNF